MKSIHAVIATQAKDIKEFSTRPIFNSLQKQCALKDLFSKNKFDYSIVYDNMHGLPKVYNSFLQNVKFNNSILLFVHDDVELEDISMIDKLQSSKFKVTGLAGCRQVDNNKPPAWHMMSNRADYVGEVAHSNDQNVWTTVFGPTNSRALLIDGLFIAVDVSSVAAKNVYFDEDFQFHHYDLSFCLRCNKEKISVGVAPIRVVHHGLGDSVNTPEWVNSAILFSKKYGNGSFNG